MTRFTTVDPPSHHQDAAIDRLLRLRTALTGMAAELASLKREHRHVRRENLALRRENVRLSDEIAHLRHRSAHDARGERQPRQ
jgi:regulator of replication initiation timing